MKHRPVSESTLRKAERAASKGWTLRETVGPATYTKLSTAARRSAKKRGGR